MSSKSKGTDYEKYVERICKAINSYNDFKLIELKQNKKVIGLSNVEHQIDIYWEFSYLGKTYKCIFECKDYKNKISKDKIATLESISRDILDSIPIIVSTKGFQSGALEYAKAKKVTPFICRTLEDEDWTICVRDIELNLILLKGYGAKITFLCDKDWLEKNNCKNIDFGKCRYSTLINYETDETISIDEFIEKYKLNLTVEKSKTIYFNNAFIKSDLENIYFKIKGLELSLNPIIETTNIEIRGDDYILGIIVDVIKDSRAVVTNEGKLKIWQD